MKAGKASFAELCGEFETTGSALEAMAVSKGFLPTGSCITSPYLAYPEGVNQSSLRSFARQALFY
jgi:hypothetical protein